MHFCSLQFLVFFLAVFALYWVRPWHRFRAYLLLVSSFAFYAAWSHWLALLVVSSATLDYALARCMAHARPRARLALLLVSLASNLGLLCYFKYVNFFLDSLRSLLTGLGVTAHLGTLDLIVPLGISFYTFEAINYLVDVYRGRIQAERNLANFLLFILFFPHLIAGPIVRAADFLPQIHRLKRWSWPRAHLGLRLILLGLIKKLALADHMALIVDPVFADPSAYSTAALWMAAVAYAIQVYGDFSGYSDMALGTAHLLGYRLAVNFNMPYLAWNIAEFWRRWHMSLSTWIRDYLFFPLGGSRGGRWKTYRNYLVAMILCGLWHGANWSFVVFGAIQGVYLSAHHAFRSWCNGRARLVRLLASAPGLAVRVAVTFVFFVLSLVVFRAVSLADAGVMLKRMFWPGEGAGLPRDGRVFWFAVAVMVLGHALGHRDRWLHLYERLPAPVRGLGYATALTGAVLLIPVTTRTFIYFVF